MINPDELPESTRKGALGVLYLRAVAAVAGYSVKVQEPDHDAVDVTVLSQVGRRHQLDFQVKCTSQARASRDGDFGFAVPIRTFDRLRIDTIVPRYLLVVVVPKSPGDWVRLSHRRLNFRRCGFWKSLRGLSASSNNSSVTVRIERANLLTPSTLQSLMVQGGAQ